MLFVCDTHRTVHVQNYFSQHPYVLAENNMADIVGLKQPCCYRSQRDDVTRALNIPGCVVIKPTVVETGVACLHPHRATFPHQLDDTLGYLGV